MSDVQTGLRRQGVLMALCAAFCTSTAGVAVRLMEQANALDILLLRSFSFFAFLAIFISLTRRTGLVGSVRSFNINSFIAATALTVSQFCFIYALLETTISNVVLTMAGVPAITAVLSIIILGRPVEPRTLAMIGLCFLGIGIMVSGGLRQGSTLGFALSLIASISFSFMLTFVKKQGDTDTLATFLLSAFMTFIACLVMQFSFNGTFLDIVLCIYLGIVTMGIQHILVNGAIQRIETTLVGLLTRSQAIMAPLWAVLLLGESIATMTLVGGGLIAIALTTEAVAATKAKRGGPRF
ncbi:DMT family transporter [Roseibium algae]|uniref:DMT family transporter n=1 Tax=Roseibium algae TaxID=3123038 RepID=A0ABU8TQU3_9HYPH